MNCIIARAAQVMLAVAKSGDWPCVFDQFCLAAQQHGADFCPKATVAHPWSLDCMRHLDFEGSA
jgi:hypothetical protein